MAELKPCPWCNHNKPFVLNFTNYNKMQICCPKCEGCGPVADTQEKAIDAWNKRS